MKTADRALREAASLPSLKVAIVHPVKAPAIAAALEATEAGLIDPVFVGPEKKIREAAATLGMNDLPGPIIGTEHSHRAAARACALAADGQVEGLMKGAGQTSELLKAVLATPALRTENRLSHVYVIETPGYHKPLIITDGGVNIAPDLQAKAEIAQNAINLFRVLKGDDATAKVAVLAAVETVNPSMPATVDAAALSVMATRRQITGGLIDGPLAFDNAISSDAAQMKGIVSEVAGDPDILLVPDLEAGNLLAKQMTFVGHADAAAAVLGARVPIILPSRADSERVRLLSCALAVKLADARRREVIR